MNSAYLYVRVSTDEQKRKGYSMPDQEDRLLKYCEYNDIKVKGIFREDFSAKNFNRPEWKKLIDVLKRNSSKESSNVLFIKWDRFSRNIEYAYEMIGLLRKYNTSAMAIDQPVDFGTPESSIMLAMYLAIPEAENERRSLNIKNGMRRARQMGRYASKAPMGYVNQTGLDGKKTIIPHATDAALIKWSFQQLAKNAYRIEDVRRMANAKGFQCSKSNFWKLIHNPVYCGYVIYSSSDEDKRIIKGVHEPIITEALYNEVQSIIDSKRKIVKKAYRNNETFILHRYLLCPVCQRILLSSTSKGRKKRYPYYHCQKGCKTRFNANAMNQYYGEKLKDLKLSAGVIPLFNLVVKDTNVNSKLAEYLAKRKLLEKQIKEQGLFIGKVRKLFVTGKIEFDDFSKLKKEYLIIANHLKDELEKVTMKLTCVEKQLNSFISFDKILHKFSDLNVVDKKQMIDFIPPGTINLQGEFFLQTNNALSKILRVKRYRGKLLKIITTTKPDLPIPNRYFKDRKLTIKNANKILARNGISVNDDEAAIILDFLYFIAKFTKHSGTELTPDTLTGIRTTKRLDTTVFCRENRLGKKIV